MSDIPQMSMTGIVQSKRTIIPYEVDPVSVGTDSKYTHDGDKKVNEKACFPHKDKKYTIECRLRIDKYTRPEADARCKEIHGTTFDGVFGAGSFFVYWSKA